ncbi:Hpt domain-containing protein [Nocardioides sp. 503]|uniref:Hpt domain-containing protein n=1 Tax=Nocardioides sp. 503 TaxID=2508326 RepID=UPI00106FF2BF|nr:Hpt domain-containing protein [Nocardioides sp. 503]
MTHLDTASLERLARDVSSWPFVVTFAEKYQQLLPDRVRRVIAAITEGDLDQALDAALSLRVSSAFVGALELVDLAHRLETHLRLGDLAAARLPLGLVPEAAQRAEQALATYLSGRADDA